MLTLKEWTEKATNPELTFDGVLSQLRTWTGINTLSASEVLDYTVFLYGSLLIPDYPVLVLKAMTTSWAAVNGYKFTTLANTTKQEYNPIENYDRYEESSTDTSSSGEESSTRTPDLTTSTERTPTLTTTDTDTRQIVTSSEGTAESTGNVAAYDSSTYSPDTKANSETEGETTETHSGALTRVESGKDETETTHTGTETNEATRSESSGTEYEAHTHGNIGVTTTQQMLEQERQIANFVFLDIFLGEWAARFAIGVYAADCEN